jgi:hypothetical protein
MTSCTGSSDTVAARRKRGGLLLFGLALGLGFLSDPLGLPLVAIFAALAVVGIMLEVWARAA